MSWWVGGSLRTCSFLFFGLGAAAAHNISTKAERGSAYSFFLLRLRYYYCCFLCVYYIAVAAVEKGYAFLFFGRGTAAANHFSCWLR